ncbi:class I SAM-dependent methyltransferase [Thermaurantiacus tibetensis]|uniref:class I SAM-dependent methyltransferase n=1 Tax=Thermaurantiacus tibetensis TaxID=2759035 RepID=UPI00188ED29F|nr:methyltransferase domain-containing protein [Thermaurantiacus tibetensis]
MPRPRSPAASALAALALASAAPAVAQHAGHAPGASHAPASHAEEMNQRWLAPDLDAAAWARRFEDPGRDVIANREAIVTALGLRPGQAVADVGAGTGAFLGALARAVGPEGRVYAVDISPGFAAFMAERAAREGLANVTVILGRADDPTLPPAALDAVLTVNTFHHFEAPEAMLGHLRRALKPGGQLVVVDFDPARRRAGQGAGMDALDKASLVRLVEAHGFRLAEDVPLPTLRENHMLRFTRR